MRLHIAADIGGTFTDIVYRNSSGVIDAVKSPTTPGNLVDGVLDGIDLIAQRKKQTLTETLAQCDRLALGTTAATNAVLESKAAKTGLICTEGHCEVLTIREGGKEDTYNIRLDFPEPYIPRELTFGVIERMDADGNIVLPLDEGGTRAAIEHLVAIGVEAIAVAMLWAIANPAHEKRVGELIEEIAPRLPYSLSHAVSPVIREYRRTSATAIDASLKPITINALENAEQRLRACGFGGTLTLVTSSGGQTSPVDAAERPVHLCFSGPSAAPSAGSTFLAAEAGDWSGNFVTIDMGGTSFDVCIVSDWQIPMHREGTIADHAFGVPSVELHTVGAGGGSIARVDAGGFPHVGPESAGSMPGPACYQRGGRRATVTDANLVLGYLDPKTFANGAIQLSRDAAVEAVRKDVAEPLGLSTEEAASLIGVTCEQSMVGAIEDITIKRGVDPREYVMIAGGAAAGLHAVAIARELHINQILVPRFAAVLSAFGILTGNVKRSFARSLFLSSECFDFDRINETISSMEKQAQAYLDSMGIPEDQRRNEFSVEARYAGQVWQLTLPLTELPIAEKGGLERLVESFHVLHEKLYSIRCPSDPIEIVEINLLAIGTPSKPKIQCGPTKSYYPDPTNTRPVYFGRFGWEAATPIYDGVTLKPGAQISGPAVVNDPLTTLVLIPGSQAELSSHGNYRIKLD